MSMRRRLAALASVGFVVAAVTAFTIAPAAPAASRGTGRATIATPVPVSGTITQDLVGTFPADAVGGTFSGTLSQLHFVTQNGQLTVQGLLNGTLTSASNAVLGTVTNQLVTLPIGSAANPQACTILDLTIQPIDLNLLGLLVHTDTIHLNITAQPQTHFQYSSSA